MDLAKKALIRTKNVDLSAALDTIIQIQDEETKLPKPTIKSNISLLKPTWKCNACTLQNTNSLTNKCSICTTQAPIEAYYTEEELKQEEEGKKKVEEVTETPKKPVQDDKKEEVVTQPQVNEEEKKREELENRKREIIEKGEIAGRIQWHEASLQGGKKLKGVSRLSPQQMDLFETIDVPVPGEKEVEPAL